MTVLLIAGAYAYAFLLSLALERRACPPARERQRKEMFAVGKIEPKRRRQLKPSRGWTVHTHFTSAKKHIYATTVMDSGKPPME